MFEKVFSYKFYRSTETAWDAMHESITNATRSIFWELYIFVDDAAGMRFVDTLAEKAKQGVEVKLIVDALGSSKFSESSRRRLIAAGAKVVWYNRIYQDLRFWQWITRLLNRNHRKVLIIDEEVAFLGGVNVKEDFRSWDDIFIRLTGRIAKPLLRGFARSYIASGGSRTDVKRLLHHNLEEALPEWREKIRFILHSPSGAKLPKTKLFYLKAFAIAKERINLLTPYYVPDPIFLRALALASSRGVKINIFIPYRTDLQLMELLARTYFEATIKAGASIFLLNKMNHGKALSVDGSLGLVGSINLMPRSFSRQEESAVSFKDPQMVAELNSMFEELKAGAEELNMEKWRRRPLRQRFSEWLAKKLEYFV